MLFLFSDFVTQGYKLDLIEELNDDQKKLVDTWKAGRAAEISSEAIPRGQDRISIPLESKDDNKEVVPHPKVKEHLEKNGFKIKDYRAGTATKEGDKREFKIGKILNATKADKEITNAFQNDPNRAAVKSGSKGLRVVISRHPHDVAGMSTDQGWRSCMTMGDDKQGGGCNQHYLQHDVEQGTHVAYLVHDDDPEAKKPLARIALKPFEPDDDSKKTILRPETTVYGTADSAFDHTVRKWAEQNFPTEKGVNYIKNKKLYHDSGARMIVDSEAARQSKDPKIRKRGYAHNNSLTPEILEQGLNDPDKSVRAYVAQHPDMNEDLLRKAADHEDKGVRGAIARIKGLPEDVIRKLAADKEVSVRKKLADVWGGSYKKIPADTLEQLSKDKNADIRASIVKHPKATKEMLDRAVEDKDAKVRLAAIENGKLNSDHITKLLDDPDQNVQRSLFHNNFDKLNDDHINHIINKADPKAIEYMLDGDNYNTAHWRDEDKRKPSKITSEHLDKIIDNLDKLKGTIKDDDKNELSASIARSSNLSDKQRDRLFSIDDDEVKKGVLRSADVPDEFKHKVALSDDVSDDVRRSAISRANDKDVISQYIEKYKDAFNPEREEEGKQEKHYSSTDKTGSPLAELLSTNVGFRVGGGGKLTPEHYKRLIEIAKNSKNPDVQKSVSLALLDSRAHHAYMSPEDKIHFMNHPDRDIRKEALFVADKDQLKHIAEKDPDEEIRNAAKERHDHLTKYGF